MTDQQWKVLKEIVSGTYQGKPQSGFIIDCPWIPGWYGISLMEYFSDNELWFKSNLKAIETFPDTMFLPGFWSEFGMCTEPSAFGVRTVFFENEFPHAHPVITSPDDIDRLPDPDPSTDGLLPFMLKRLKLMEPRINAAGHRIRFSVSRGPLNIASFLMGTTEFLTLLMMDPDQAHKLIKKVNDLLIRWHELQMKTFPDIDGIMVLDDIIGFIGEDEFKEFGLPYLKELYSFDVSVKFLHNDAQCESSIVYLPEIGINLFNMAFDTNLNDLKLATSNKVTMLGNIPPRDVLANGSPADVANAVKKMKNTLQDPSRVLFSCGGGMPMGVKTENIEAFLKAVRE